MDMRRAREIVDRADECRRMFADRRFQGMWRERTPKLAALAMFGAIAVPFLALLANDLGPVGVIAAFAAVYGLPVVAVLSLLAWLRRGREQDRLRHAARAQCPRCGAALRDDGPSSWTACGPADMVCAACGTVVTEEVYAAATLRSPWRTLCRDAMLSVRFAAFTLLLLAIPVASFALLLARATAIDIETSDAEMDAIQRQAEWTAHLVPIVSGAVLATIIGADVARRRSIRARFNRWIERPECLACASPLPAPRDAPLVICPTCNERHSTAQVLVDAVDGARRPVWKDVLERRPSASRRLL